MPIEIRELLIKAHIENGKTEGGEKGKGGGNQEEIIAACVEQVMQLLKEQRDR